MNEKSSQDKQNIRSFAPNSLNILCGKNKSVSNDGSGRIDGSL